jgi:hypothetical protein
MIAALAIAAFLAPFASQFPDGLEAVAQRQGFIEHGSTWSNALLADYEFQLPRSWQALSVSLAGVVGTIAVATIALMFGRMLKSRSSPAIRHVE